MPLLFVIWLFLTVLSPHQDLYKVFFHGIVIPSLLILLFARRTGVNWKDPFLLVSLTFFAYASLSTFIVGFGPMDEHVRAFRWGVEVTFGLLALYVWMPYVVKSPRWWARLFLWLALLGALAAIINFVFYHGLQGRLGGLGALHNPIQAGSILLVYFALGHFMLTRGEYLLSKTEKILLVASLVNVCLATLLSESRAPIGAMILYLIYLAALQLYRKPDMRDFLAVGGTAAAIVGAMALFYDGGDYLQQLLGRGMSYRMDIWAGYLEYPPASWWVGFGAGTPPEALPAAEAYWIPNGAPVTHAHNLFLGTLAETGIIGLAFLLVMIGLVVAGIAKRVVSAEEKVRLLGLLGLVFLLTLTGSHTVVSSIKAVWLFLWIPIIFVWFWTLRHRLYRQASEAG